MCVVCAYMTLCYSTRCVTMSEQICERYDIVGKILHIYLECCHNRLPVKEGSPITAVIHGCHGISRMQAHDCGFSYHMRVTKNPQKGNTM
jgi:hypothetical protein